MWAELQRLLLELLITIEGIVGDWGMAIIVLTVAVRLVLMPLTIKQTRSMYELQRIQPKIKELQKKYANDKEKLQEETLKYYQDNKVNPFGGCLPMLIQMPLLILLYQVLGGTQGKPGPLMRFLLENDLVGSFYGLIPNIAMTPSAIYKAEGVVAAIPYVLLVLLFGVSVWLPQQLMPGDKQQKQIGGYMAIMMLFFGWSAPAGVLLYWDVSSLWGVAQQQIMMRYMKTHPHEEEETVTAVESAVEQKPKPKSSKKKK